MATLQETISGPSIDPTLLEEEKKNIRMRNRIAGIEMPEDILQETATKNIKERQSAPSVPSTPTAPTAEEQAKEEPVQAEPVKQEESAAPTEEQVEPAQPKTKGYKPADYSKFKQSVPKLEKMSGQLAPEERQVYEGKIDEIRQRLDTAERLYAENKQTTEYAQVAEIIGQALTQLAAGWYGMKTGYDLSGIKFNKIDWEKKLDRVYNEFDTKYNRDLKNFERAQGDYEGAQASRAKTAAEYNKELEQQARKIEEKNVDLDVKTEKSAEEARRFAAEQANRTLRDQMDKGPSSKEDRRERDILNIKEKEVSRAEKALNSEIPKLKKSGDKVDSLRSFLKARGIDPSEIKKIEEGDDVLYTTDKERASRLSSKASELLGQMKDDFQRAQQNYINRSSGNASPVPAKEKQSTERRVTVRSPNGEEGTIPESQLEEAKAAGYVEVQ